MRENKKILSAQQGENGAVFTDGTTAHFYGFGPYRLEDANTIFQHACQKISGVTNGDRKITTLGVNIDGQPFVVLDYEDETRIVSEAAKEGFLETRNKVFENLNLKSVPEEEEEEVWNLLTPALRQALVQP